MYLLFDIGGTKLRYAFSKDGKDLEKPVIVASPAADFSKAKELFLKIKKELPVSRVEAVVAGLAGPLSKDRATLTNSPHLTGWIGKPVKEELERTFDSPAYLENDSALVGLGEATHGAGQGYSIVVYMSVSTGVGGVRLVDQRIDRNSLGFEPGHQIIDIAGKFLCPGLGCNMPGHLEGYVSGAAIQRRFQKDPSEIADPAVWDELAQWLAVGLNNTIVHWSPDIVVLGGSMITKKPGIELAAVEKYLSQTLRIFPQPPVIKQGTLGDLGGLYGALEFAKQHV